MYVTILKEGFGALFSVMVVIALIVLYRSRQAVRADTTTSCVVIGMMAGLGAVLLLLMTAMEECCTRNEHTLSRWWREHKIGLSIVTGALLALVGVNLIHALSHKNSQPGDTKGTIADASGVPALVGRPAPSSRPVPEPLDCMGTGRDNSDTDNVPLEEDTGQRPGQATAQDLSVQGTPKQNSINLPSPANPMELVDRELLQAAEQAVEESARLHERMDTGSRRTGY
jgi:hypothetical protein